MYYMLMLICLSVVEFSQAKDDHKELLFDVREINTQVAGILDDMRPGMYLTLAGQRYSANIIRLTELLARNIKSVDVMSVILGDLSSAVTWIKDAWTEAFRHTKLNGSTVEPVFDQFSADLKVEDIMESVASGSHEVILKRLRDAAREILSGKDSLPELLDVITAIEKVAVAAKGKHISLF